jgi:peptidyl-dipeptidase Dcp
MKRQGQMLGRAQAALAPKFAAYSDTIYLDPKLFARVKALRDHSAAPNRRCC